MYYIYVNYIFYLFLVYQYHLYDFRLNISPRINSRRQTTSKDFCSMMSLLMAVFINKIAGVA